MGLSEERLRREALYVITDQARRLARLSGRQGLLSDLRMAELLRQAAEAFIREQLTYEKREERARIGDVSWRVTWQEVGEALGVSAQAAHRKYRER